MTSIHAQRTATLGIDLASQPKNTSACRIEWTGTRGVVLDLPSEPLVDSVLIDQIRDTSVTKVAIDAPFGWPVPFVDALVAYRDRVVWPDAPGSRDVQDTMELRATDRAVWRHTGVKPLSVTTDRIAYAAMRVAKLLSALSSAGEAIDRSGRGHIMEVYPEAALRCWKLSPALQSEDPGGYKGNRPAAIDRRKRLVDRVLEETADWLEVPGSVVAACLASDDDLDALLCALIAHAVDCGRAEPVSDLARAKAEGWIRLPLSEPLRELGRGRV